jgi:hypothetical protein
LGYYFWQNKRINKNMNTNINTDANNITLAQSTTESETGNSNSIVDCGNDGEDPCTIDNLIDLANNFGEYILKVVFPAAFFIGIFFCVYPLLKDPTNPENIKAAKERFLKLVIGTGFMLGAFLLVKAVLLGIGVSDGKVMNSVVSFRDFFMTSANAQSVFANPLESLSIQNIILGITNILTFFAFIGIILGIVRGVILLMLGQQNPENLQKGKKWLMYTLLVATIVFGAELGYNIIKDTVTSVFK